MTISIVQSKLITGANSGSFSSATTAGNTLLIAYAGSAGSGSFATPGLTAVTLGGSNDNWAQQVNQNDGNSASCSEIWMDPACAGGQTTVAVSGNHLVAADAYLLLLELSGMGPTPALDQHSVGPIKAGTQTWTSNATPTTTSANEFVLGVTAHGPNSASDTLTGPGSPWTNASGFTWSNGSAIAGYQIVTSTGTFTYSGTSVDFDYYTCVIGTFAPGGIAVLPPSQSVRARFISVPMLRQRPRPAPTPPFGGITEGPSPALNANYDFETTVSPWVAYPYGSVAQASNWSSHGSHSLQFTPDGVHSSGVWSESGIPVLPGSLITFSFVAYCANGWTGSGNGVQAVFWWTSAGSNGSGGSVIPLSAATSTPVSYTVQAPFDVTSVQLEIGIGGIPSAATLFNFDMAMVTILQPIDNFVPNPTRYPQRYVLIAASRAPRQRQTPDTIVRSSVLFPAGTDVPRYPQRIGLAASLLTVRRRQNAELAPLMLAPVAKKNPVTPRYPEKVIAPWSRRNRGVVPTGLPVLMAAPERIQAVRRWSRPLWPRRGTVPPSGLPFVIPPTPLNPVSVRREQRYQWFRRGNVPPTGWPIPVQPPMTSQWLRRWSKPLFPRRGVTPVNALPVTPPVPMWYRARFKPPYPRKGNPQPTSGLPVPVQPKEVPHSVRARFKPPWPRRGIAWPESGAFPIPVQPPKTSMWLRRWSKPLFPRRGRVNNHILPGTQILIGYQQLQLKTFSYIPGAGGVDLSAVNLSLFPLDTSGVSFPNWYGNVVLLAHNATSLPVQLTPNVVRTVEKQSVQLPPYVLAPGAIQMFGPFPVNDFTDVDGNMTINIEASDSGLYTGAFWLQWAPPIGHTGPYDLLGARLRRLIAQHEVNISATPGDLHPGESTPGG